MSFRIDEEAFSLRLRAALGKRHRFGGGGRLIEQRGVGDVEPGQIRDHGLEVEQRFQPALADLRLIRRVGRVPGRVLQDVALDHRRQDRARIALANQRGEGPVLRRQLLHMRERFGLAQGGAEIERRLLPDRSRQRLAHQRLQALRPDRLQHRRNVAGRGTDMAADEGGRGVVGNFALCGHKGLAGRFSLSSSSATRSGLWPAG